jgi:dTDP-4-dehydrorhamnose 3,5-epimerase
MEIKKTMIEGLTEIIPSVFSDERGYFFELYQNQKFKELGLTMTFVQDNQSFSKKNVIRGLHFQSAPYSQGKLVMAITGKVLDVALDLRSGSPTFGKYERIILDSRIHNMLYIPEGFAHGFSTLEDSVFLYKCTSYYNKAADGGIIWNDPKLNIDWKVNNPIISEKDKALPLFAEFKHKVGLT